MKYEFAPAAREELLHTIEYYELQQPRLGLAFSGEVRAAIDQILEFPNGWTPLDATFHRCLVKQFPFGLIYTFSDQVVTIVAMMNLHRKPNYWRSR